MEKKEKKIVMKMEDFEKMVDETYKVEGNKVVPLFHPDMSFYDGCGCEKCVKALDKWIKEHTFDVEVI